MVKETKKVAIKYIFIKIYHKGFLALAEFSCNMHVERKHKTDQALFL